MRRKLGRTRCKAKLLERNQIAYPLYRGADLSIVWLDILATAAIGSVYFGFALYRFRRVIFSG
jgi:hypothetical protein